MVLFESCELAQGMPHVHVEGFFFPRNNSDCDIIVVFLPRE
jgi:hypothetical protein